MCLRYKLTFLCWFSYKNGLNCFNAGLWLPESSFCFCGKWTNIVSISTWNVFFISILIPVSEFCLRLIIFLFFLVMLFLGFWSRFYEHKKVNINSVRNIILSNGTRCFPEYITFGLKRTLQSYFITVITYWSWRKLKFAC